MLLDHWKKIYSIFLVRICVSVHVYLCFVCEVVFYIYSIATKIGPRYEHVDIYLGNPETLTTFFVQVRNIYWLLEFSLFDTRREKHNFYYADYFIWPNNARRIPSSQLDWPRPAQKSTRFVQRQISTNCFFSKSPKFSAPRFRAWRHSHAISHLGFLLWHLWLTHPLCASVNTCAQCVYLHVH